MTLSVFGALWSFSLVARQSSLSLSRIILHARTLSLSLSQLQVFAAYLHRLNASQVKNQELVPQDRINSEEKTRMTKKERKRFFPQIKEKKLLKFFSSSEEKFLIDGQFKFNCSIFQFLVSIERKLRHSTFMLRVDIFFYLRLCSSRMRLHQRQVALLVPDDGLLRIALDKNIFFYRQYEQFFIGDKYCHLTICLRMMTLHW